MLQFFFSVQVDNYQKGKTIVEELSRERIQIPQLPESFTWMQVSGGSKIRNLMSIALKGFSEHGAVVWSGAGPAINKTISCAEILKRRHKPFQITKICFRRTEEFWDPILPDLDQIVVEREEPVVHILLSRNPLNADEPGYQAPGYCNPHFNKTVQPSSSSRHHTNSVQSKKKTSRGSSDWFNVSKEQNTRKPNSKSGYKKQSEGPS